MLFNGCLKFLACGLLATCKLQDGASKPRVCLRMPPRALQEGPNVAQHGPRCAQDDPYWAKLGPKMPQHRAKTGPRWAQDGSKHGCRWPLAALLATTWLPRPARIPSRPQPNLQTAMLACFLDLPAPANHRTTFAFQLFFEVVGMWPSCHM